METKTLADKLLPNETDFATVIGEKLLKLRFSAEISVCFAPQSKKISQEMGPEQ